YIFSNSNYKNKSKRIDNEIYRLFLINLSLSIYDVKLDESIKYASDIEELKSFIDKDGYLHEQKEKMLKKANFLLFKWQKRSEKNNNKVAFIVDGEEKENYEAEFINYGGKWKEMVEYISNHYLDSDSNYQIKKSFQKLIGKNFEDYSCQDIHLYIKYYKDVENDLKKLDEIIEFIKSKPNNEIYSIIYKYAINNRFSLFIENCNDKNKIYEEYSKIKDDDKNYFQQYKFIKKSIEIINDFLQKDDISSEELKEIKSFVDGKIENEYKKYKANMEWSLQHSNYYIYRVSYEECMIDDIFMYSSFLLPHSNKEASLNYEIISTEYQVLKSQIEPLIKVNTLLSETKKINEDINKNKIQIIEITGIFLAVIAFVMSSVNGFQFVTDIWSAFLFMVIFATCLISFLLLIILITRRNENIKKFRDIILIFYVAMFVSICLLGCIISYNEEKKQTNTIKTDYLKISTEIKKDTIQVKPNMKKK
ncbi:MAG: hypothetical protein Q4C75_06280, partial [Bergeyella zoohelcum]|nr:hypothetical protein [Bergeyella zoohelcum]